MAALAVFILLATVSVVAPVQGMSHLPRLTLAEGQAAQTAVHPFADPGPRVQAERLPLIEVFTATWCPPCAPADRALERLLDERSPALARNGDVRNDSLDLAVLAYHPWPDMGAEDPFGIPEGQERMRAKYDAFWFPSVYVDGYLEDAPATRSVAVDAGMEEILYGSYSGLTKRADAIPPAFTLTSSWDRQGANVTARLELEATAVAEGPFYVRGVLWEDHIRFPGSNGIETHRMTVRALTDREIVQTLEPGETWEGEWPVRVPQGVNLSRSGMTFIVERAWGHPGGDQASVLMGYALGVAAVSAAVVLALRLRMVRGRRDWTDRPADPRQDPGARGPRTNEEAVG